MKNKPLIVGVVPVARQKKHPQFPRVMWADYDPAMPKCACCANCEFWILTSTAQMTGKCGLTITSKYPTNTTAEAWCVSFKRLKPLNKVLVIAMDDEGHSPKQTTKQTTGPK